MLIGPHAPGLVGDVQIATQLAEVGVILLMFGVGLHFHLKDLIAVKNVAIPGAVGQSVIATVLAMAIFPAFGMPPITGMVLGMAMAVASTVVLMRVLMDAVVMNTLQSLQSTCSRSKIPHNQPACQLVAGQLSAATSQWPRS